jgi:hypothetical protein
MIKFYNWTSWKQKMWLWLGVKLNQSTYYLVITTDPAYYFVINWGYVKTSFHGLNIPAISIGVGKE